MWLRSLTSIFFLSLTGCATSFHSINQQTTSNALKVDVLNGNVHPVSFIVTKNHCQQIPITAMQTDLPSTLQACYYGNSLFLDPSKLGKNQTQGAIRFNFIPLWQQGFIYNNITSSGYTKLEDVDIRIQTQD